MGEGARMYTILLAFEAFVFEALLVTFFFPFLFFFSSHDGRARRCIVFSFSILQLCHSWFVVHGRQLMAQMVMTQL